MKMKTKESVVRKLISEIKKPGRECLYDMSQTSYKNNHLKQITWKTIADTIGIERSQCQAIWKSLRRQHKAALNKRLESSGSKRVKLNEFTKFLITELDYFQKFWNSSKPKANIESNTDSIRDPFDKMLHDPEIIDVSSVHSDLSIDNQLTPSPSTFYKSGEMFRQKRARINDLEEEYKESLKTLNNLATTVLRTTTEKRDPFFLALEDEFLKVPEKHKSILKVQLMSLIVDHQNNS